MILHSIVNYYKCRKHNVLGTEEHLMISDDHTHDKYAVKHSEEISLKSLQDRGIHIKKILQFCDNCSAHYKNCCVFEFLCPSPIPKFRSYFSERHGKGPADGVIGRAKTAFEWAVKSHNENLLRNPYEVYVFLKEKFQVDDDEEECPHFIQKFFYVPKETINRELEVIGETIKGSSTLHSISSTGHKNIVKARNIICLCNRCLSRESILCVNAQYASEFQSYSLEIRKAVKNPVQNSHWPTGIVQQKEILEKEMTDATNTEPVDCTLPVHTDTCINWDALCNTFLDQHTFGSLYELIFVKKLTDLPYWMKYP